MSFICDITKKHITGERSNKVVVERRETIYKDAEGNEVSRGWEIKKEVQVGSEGLKILQANSDPQ